MEIIKKISSYLLIGILVLSAILLTVASLIKWNLKENRIMNYMKENDLSFILKTKDGYTTDLLEDTKTYLEKIGIPKEAIEEVINSNPTKEFVGKYTYKILNYIIYKKGSVQITKEDILDLVKNNFPVVETALKEQNQPFLPEYQKNILLLIDKYIDHIMDLFPTVNHLITKIEQEEF